MKKRYAVIVLAVVLLFACSCGGAPGEDPSNDKALDSSSSGEPEVEVFPISEIISEEGSFTDEAGGECLYSYHVPQLDADTPDAAYINDVINSLYDDIVTESMASIEQKIMPECASIEWESYQNGPVVSLVIKAVAYYAYREDYSVFNYDAERGVQLFTPDILAMENVSEDAYYNELRRTVIQDFDDRNFDVFTEWGDTYSSYYSERRGWTCSNESIVDQQMTYLDANGDLTAVVDVGSLAEADYYARVYTLDMSEKTSAAIEGDYSGLFSAVLENEELTVFVAGESATESASDRGTPYPVHGAYSDYTQLQCGEIEQAGAAYVVLLTDEGRVEFVNVSNGSYYEYFCVNGPILGVEDIVSLETAVADNGFETIVAVDGSGEEIDLAPFVQASELSISDRFLTGWSTNITYETDGGGSYEELCSLDISGWNQAKVEMYNYNIDMSSAYTGGFTFLGTAEDGSVYAFSFTGEDGSIVYEGVASLAVEYYEGMNGFANYFHWKDLNGTGIFTTTGGEEVIFTEAFG